MSNAGYSGTPLPRKLGIKDGHVVATFGAPPHIPRLMSPLPSGARLLEEPREDGPFDVVLVFVRTAEELSNRFRRGQRILDPFGGLWVGWPKQSSPLAGELNGNDVRAHGLSTGLVDNKVCAIDADWSGLRFVVRKENRPRRTKG